MANTIYWGQAAVENTNGFGKSATNNTNDFGEICADSWSPETNLTGTGATPSFSNTQSIELDGIDDYVTLGAMTGSSLAITGDISISMWLKFSNSGGTEYAMNMGDSYGIYTSGGTIRGFSRVSGTFTTLSSVGTFNDNVWHNVLYVKNSTNMLLYIDGVLNASNTNGGTSTITGLDMRLGARYTTANFYEGLMDEVAIWNSDQSANASVIGSTLPTDLSTYNPISWWRCGDNDTSPTLTDNGSGGNNGTMTNFTTFSTDVPT